MDLMTGNFVWLLAGFTLIAVLGVAFWQLARVKRRQSRTAVQVEERRGTPMGTTTTGGRTTHDPGVRR